MRQCQRQLRRKEKDDRHKSISNPLLFALDLKLHCQTTLASVDLQLQATDPTVVAKWSATSRPTASGTVKHCDDNLISSDRNSKRSTHSNARRKEEEL
ncbi:uncharacterized protein FMAN_14853 [Fusarium mangiferae]|uniref:Uncharacterized protein n=1 Tax=Fusarium mangiferae TaxID=192010 RepID=A0A1L7U6S3_FUSMA|nr:uncharacterized protein FMAN_14853 [Fusarium mangiferae]CVL04053.1 uncharacterized protein FMAN_14853 [Fusarium mangiferae]